MMEYHSTSIHILTHTHNFWSYAHRKATEVVACAGTELGKVTFDGCKFHMMDGWGCSVPIAGHDGFNL